MPRQPRRSMPVPKTRFEDTLREQLQESKVEAAVLKVEKYVLDTSNTRLWYAVCCQSILLILLMIGLNATLFNSREAVKAVAKAKKEAKRTDDEDES